MRRKRFLAVLTAFLLVVLLAACGRTEVEDSGQTSAAPDASPEEPFPITMQYIVGTQGDDFPKVEAAISDLAEEELNMTVQLIPCSFGNYEQQQKLMLSSGEPLDVFIMGGQNAYSYISSGYLVDMSPLIDEYGQGVLEQLGESIGKAMTIDGFQFAVPPFIADAECGRIVS